MMIENSNVYYSFKEYLCFNMRFLMDIFFNEWNIIINLKFLGGEVRGFFLKYFCINIVY